MEPVESPSQTPTPALDATNKIEVTPLEPPLSRAEAQKAIPHLIRDFPAIVRSDIDPPVEGQTRSVLAFKMLDKPVRKGDAIMYGFVKIRGVDPTLDLAKMRAVNLVQNVDSATVNYIAQTGHWYPILKDPSSAVKDKVHTGTSAHGSTLVSDIAKISEKLDKEKYQAYVEKTKREAKELQERIDLVGKDHTEDSSSIEYYTFKRNAWRNMWRLEKELEIRLEKIRANKVHARGLCAWLDERYPEHAKDDAWLKLLNKRGAQTGSVEQFISDMERADYAVLPEKTIEPDDAPLPPEVDPELLPLSSARGVASEVNEDLAKFKIENF